MLQKIISAEQTRRADRYTIENEPVASIDLMERASVAFVQAVEDTLRTTDRILVVCGTGNNGGDGLAVTRILRQKGYSVNAAIVYFSETLSHDCAANAIRLNDVVEVCDVSELPDASAYSVIVDALFGSGLSRPADGLARAAIEWMNDAAAQRISIDVPSGMFCDALNVKDAIVYADLVVSFQRPKRVFFFPESGPFVKCWKCADIGLNEEFIQSLKSNEFVLDKRIQQQLKERKRFSHKGTYGHALIVAGSYGKIGAAVLAARACMRSGAGLTTGHIPKCGYSTLQSSVPEAMCITDPEMDFVSQLPDCSMFNAMGIGPGLGTHAKTVEFLRQLLNATTQPIVLDADALNMLSEHPDLLNSLPKNSILTPHPKEFERLVGAWADSEERLAKQKEFSSAYNCIVVLKDAHTCVSDSGGNAFFNTSGNPGMATGGSGDVLTGMITGLLAQGYSALNSACIGVYFHGRAGDTAAELRGRVSMMASDVIEAIRIE